MPPTPAQATAGLVLAASLAGTRLNIPGGLDVRVGHAPSRASDASGSSPPAQQEGTAPDLERREYERAGGGAPSERGITRRPNVIERLCRFLRAPTGRQ